MKLFVIDTNVILMAGTKLRDLADDKIEVFEKCILFLHEIMNNGARV